MGAPANKVDAKASATESNDKIKFYRCNQKCYWENVLVLDGEYIKTSKKVPEFFTEVEEKNVPGKIKVKEI